MLAIDQERLFANFDAVGRIGNLGPGVEHGFLRAGYSAEESAAIRYVEAEARKLGLNCRYDAIGNFTAETADGAAQYVEAGSHLDTVPFGGHYDGVAGVLCGLEAIAAILRSGRPRHKGLRLRIWRLEESGTYGSLFLGSSGAFGQADPKFLEQSFSGQTLEAAMRGQGCDPQVIRAKSATIPQTEIDSIAAHLELHIEQGVFLERTGTDIGIVTGMRGPRRYRVVLRGQFDHSGATPMGVEFRKDANLALSYIGVALDRLLQEHCSAGGDLVQTIGVINCDPEFNELHAEIFLNSLTKVSGFAYFTWDVRSIDAEYSRKYCERGVKLINDTAREFGVEAAIELRSTGPGVSELNPAVQQALQAACAECGLSAQLMPSGAGHDSGVLAKQKQSDGKAVPVGMIFIPCKNGISHSPDEYASPDAIVKGTQALAEAMLRLAA